MTSPIEQFDGPCPKCGHVQTVSFRASWNETISGPMPSDLNEHTCTACGATFHAGDALIVRDRFVSYPDDFGPALPIEGERE